ncbi:MAG: hypothetical protein AB8B99_14250 [Phormidesmis sp.]
MNIPTTDLDAIARNLIALDLAHLSPEEAAPYEHELSIITALNDAIETATHALTITESSDFWQRLHPILSNAAALLTSQTAPLITLNAERHLETTGQTLKPSPTPITAHPLCTTAPAIAATTGTWPSFGPSSASS